MSRFLAQMAFRVGKEEEKMLTIYYIYMLVSVKAW